MFKIDKTLVDNMNQKRSFIVITHKPKEDIKELLIDETALLDADTQMPQAVRDRAQELLQSAQVKAQKLAKAAECEAETLKNDAREQGYNEGMADAAEKIEQVIAARNEEASALIKELAAYKNDLYVKLMDSVLPLAMDIAEKIINIELQKDDRVYMEIAKKAVLELKQSDSFTVRVGRGEFDKYFKDGGQWLREQTGSGAFEVICDPGLAAGDLVIESDEEVVNASIAMQLEKTQQYLREQVE